MAASRDAGTRGHTYNLLSRLYLRGLTEGLLPDVQTFPKLAEALPTSYDADEAAADHHQLFGFNVFPYQSIFLDQSGLMGGLEADAVLRSYAEAGYPVGDAADSPDHIGHELSLLAFLCHSEAKATQNKLPDKAKQITVLQRRFLSVHLLRWLLPLTLAISQQGHPFYTAVADLTLELIQEHWQTGGSISTDEIETPLPLPEPPDLLDKERTGLKDIADYLLTPVYSGVYLSRDDIARLARSQTLPRGFGDRRTQLLNLFRSAAHYGEIGKLLFTLGALVNRWIASYEDWGGAGSTAVYAHQWKALACRTANMLAQMNKSAGAL